MLEMALCGLGWGERLRQRQRNEDYLEVADALRYHNSLYVEAREVMPHFKFLWREGMS